MGLIHLGVLVVLLIHNVCYAGIAAPEVCHASNLASSTTCDANIAFVFVATSAREDQLARQSIWSLQYHGQWSGPIVFVSTCDKQQTSLSSSGSFHRVTLSTSHRTLPAFQYHQGRLAEVLRFVPGHIQTTVLVSPGTLFARPVQPLIADLHDVSAGASRGFIAAFPSHAHGAQKVFSPSLLAVNRRTSIACLRSAQLVVARRLSDQNPGVPADSLLSSRAAPALNAVHTRAFRPPGDCSVAELDASMLRLLSASYHTMSNAPVVSLPLPSDPLTQADDDDLHDQDLNTLSQMEIDVFLRDELHVPASLQQQHTCVAGPTAELIRDDITGDQRPAMTTESCAPHGVLAGYAKCATSTLHAWLLMHPEIILPWTKEPNFDFRDRVSAVGRQYLQDLHAGRDQVHNGITPWFTLDGSTHLAWNMTHLRNLKKFCPTTKIAVLTCDPIKRLVSHWNYRRFVWEWEFLEGKSVNDAVRRQLNELPTWVKQGRLADVDRQTLLDFDLDGDDSQGVWNMVREGLYAVNVAQIKAIFSASQVMVLNKDDMIRSPTTVLRQLEQFYGLRKCNYPESGISAKRNVNKHRKEALTTELTAELKRLYGPYNRMLEGEYGWSLNW